MKGKRIALNHTGNSKTDYGSTKTGLQVRKIWPTKFLVLVLSSLLNLRPFEDFPPWGFYCPMLRRPVEGADQSLMSTLQSLRSKRFEGFDRLDERTRLLLLSQIADYTEHDYAASADELSSTWWDEDDEFTGDHCLWMLGQNCFFLVASRQIHEFVLSFDGFLPVGIVSLFTCVLDDQYSGFAQT